MKVMGIVPNGRDSDRDGFVVALDWREWNLLVSGRATGTTTATHPYRIRGSIGEVVEINKRIDRLMDLEQAVKLAEATPGQLRGMADALVAVVDAAKKAITPPPDESVPADEPKKL